jgi:hypothetical protein
MGVHFMNTKRFFAGLTAMALSIGFLLTGCEGPAGADGSPGSGGGGGGGGSGPIEGSLLADTEAFEAATIDAVRLPPGTYALINGGAVAEINASDIAVYEGYTLNLYGLWEIAAAGDVYVGGTLNIMNNASLDVDTNSKNLYIGMATGATTGAGTVNVKAGGTLTVAAPETYLSFLADVAGGVETYEEPPLGDLADAIIDGDPLVGIPGVALTFASEGNFDSPLDTGDAEQTRGLAALTRFNLPSLVTTTADTAVGSLTVAKGNKLTITSGATYAGVTALTVNGELDDSSNTATFAAVTSATINGTLTAGTSVTFLAATTAGSISIGAGGVLEANTAFGPTGTAVLVSSGTGKVTVSTAPILTAVLPKAGSPLTVEVATIASVATGEIKSGTTVVVPSAVTLTVTGGNGSGATPGDAVELTVNGTLKTAGSGAITVKGGDGGAASGTTGGALGGAASITGTGTLAMAGSGTLTVTGGDGKAGGDGSASNGGAGGTGGTATVDVSTISIGTGVTVALTGGAANAGGSSGGIGTAGAGGDGGAATVTGATLHASSILTV